MRTIIAFTSLLIASVLHCQSVQLPADSILFACLQEYHSQQQAAQLYEYELSNKGNWLKYLPNIGITYTVAGEPRPAVSINSGLLYTANQDRKRQAANVRRITDYTRLLFLEDSTAITRNLRLIEIKERTAREDLEVLTIDEQLFQLYQAEYDAAEMTPEVFLRKKKTYLQQRQRHRLQVEEIEALKLETLFLAKCL